MPKTCEHRETTTHFVWRCICPAGHDGRGHFLRPTPIEDAP